MASPLDKSFAKIIGKGMSPFFLPASLARDTAAGTGDSFDPDAPSVSTFPCRAIHESWSSFTLSSGLVKSGERKVIILASTLSTIPAPLDRVTIRGKTFTIVNDDGGQPAVQSDPALATWTCRARQ